MPIVISRTGELNPKIVPTVTQEQRDALWAAFVTSWLDNHPDEFAQMVSDSEKQTA